MNREEVVQQSEQALQQLVAALQQGRSETLVQYLDMLSGSTATVSETVC